MQTSMDVIGMRRRGVVMLGVIASCIAGLMGCSDGLPTGTKVGLDSLVWQIRSNPDGAVMMAKDDSIQLSFTGISVNNKTTGLVKSRLSLMSEDSDFVSVSADGLVHAIRPTNGTPLKIIASYMSGGSLTADTTFVVVTETRQTVQSIAFRPDSTRTPVGYSPFLPHVVALAPDGTVLSNVLVGIYTARDNATATAIPELGQVRFNLVGPQWIYASTLAYGQRFTDSLQVTVVQAQSRGFLFNNLQQRVIVSDVSSMPSRTVQPCGWITFVNNSDTPLDITFNTKTTVVTCAMASTDTTLPTPLHVPAHMSGIRKMNGIGTATWTARTASTSVDSVGSGTIITK